MKGLLAFTSPSSPSLFCSNTTPKTHLNNSGVISATKHVVKHRGMKTRLNAVNISDASVSVDPVQAQLTWEIVVGSLAGVIPFIVAGIEFNKRIVAQRSCETCGGSGLVLRDKKYYFRCPACGGFLPWQSWKRFFSG